jgi:hypothetical protein
MSIYEAYLYLIFIVKLFVLFLFLRNKFYPTDTSDYRLQFAEGTFNVLMSMLLLFLFHPFSQTSVMVDRETRIFLCIFAILTLIHTLS